MNIERTKSLIAALILVAITLVALGWFLSSQSARAQSGGIQVDKQLGRSSNLVHVGEYLTFTIRIRNDAPFVITTLPLSDLYNNTVLDYADAVPPPDSVDRGTGQIEWNDLTDTFGDLALGQEIVVVVGFIAEHPEPVVINRAEVHDALGSGGVLSDTNSTLSDTMSVGGSSPVEKELLAGLIPQVGLPLTFTIVITNDGYTTMTVAPLVDNYPPTLLRFSYAVPPPDTVDEVGGTLTWSDLTLWTGDIPAHGTVSVTTVFTALAAIDHMVNNAEVFHARDWYDNDLAMGGDDVPITIIERPTVTPTPTDIPTPTPTVPRPASTYTPVPMTPVPEATATPIPILLPVSGQAGGMEGLSLLIALLVWSMGLATLIYACRTKMS